MLYLQYGAVHEFSQMFPKMLPTKDLVAAYVEQSVSQD